MDYYHNLKFTESGVIEDTLYEGQFNRTEELNTRIYDRFFPDTDLQPNFDPRPVSTKYALFPVLDRRPKPEVPLLSYLNYYPEVSFNPGDAKGPISGFLNNVDVESDLRNQNIYLDKDLGKKHVPSLKSDLYIVNVESKTRVEQPFPGLFTFNPIDTSHRMNSVPKNTGVDLFHNNTRVQLRNA